MKDWESLYDERGVVQREPSAKVIEAVGFFQTAKAKLKLEHYRAPSEKDPTRLAATWALYASRERRSW